MSRQAMKIAVLAMAGRGICEAVPASSMIASDLRASIAER